MKVFAKAIFATVVSALGSLAVVLVDDSSLADLTSGQWVTVALAALIAGGGVYGIANTPKGG
jgi:hypothetical protein